MQANAQWSTTGNTLIGTEKLGSLNAQSVNLYSNNVQRMVIVGPAGTNQGFIGINTTSPQQRLDVWGDINLHTNITTRTTTNDGYRINDTTVLQVKQAGNLFVGWFAGNNWISSGTAQNTFVGNYSGYNNKAGYYNVFLGFAAGSSNVSSNNNTCVGYRSGFTMTGTGTTGANTFVGSNSGYNDNTGMANTFVGHLAGYSNQTGNYDTYLGAYTDSKLPVTANSDYNTFIGHDAGHDLGNSADRNTIIGAQAGEHITTGVDNVIGGYSAANHVLTGQHNVFIGMESGLVDSMQNDNSFLGYQTGRNLINTKLCTFIGYRAGYDNTVGTHSYTNAAGIGANAIATTSNKMVLGDTTVWVGIGVSNDHTASLGAGNSLEINARTLGTGTVIANKSGLRFRQLTSTSPAGAATGKVLTVDTNGDVILVNASGGSGSVTGAHNGTSISTITPGDVALGNDAGDLSAPGKLLSHREIPMNNYNIYFTGNGAANTNTISIGTGTSGSAKLTVFNNSETSAGNFSTDATTLGTSPTPAGLISNIQNATGTAYAIIGQSSSSQPGAQIEGVYGYANGSGYSNAGVHGDAVGTASGQNNGVYGNASGSPDNRGGAFTATATGTGLNAGVYASAQLASIANYGGSFTASSSTGNTAYGIYAEASGTGANYAGYFNGDVYINGGATSGTGYVIASDQNLKTHIEPISNALSTINHIEAKSFYYDTLNTNNLKLSSKKQYGVIAQQVETVLPELVSATTKPADIDTTGVIIHPAYTFKAVNYNAFIGLLIKGMQEQQAKIDSVMNDNHRQDSINTSLQNQLNTLSGIINTCCNNRSMQLNNSNTAPSGTSIDVDLKDVHSIVLDQNVPNPFAEQTTISYFLPDNITRAQMFFYNAQGRLIQTVELKEKGKGQLNVFANDLTNGIYTYTLIVDGKIFGTKKMVKN